MWYTFCMCGSMQVLVSSFSMSPELSIKTVGTSLRRRHAKGGKGSNSICCSVRVQWTKLQLQRIPWPKPKIHLQISLKYFTFSHSFRRSISLSLTAVPFLGWNYFRFNSMYNNLSVNISHVHVTSSFFLSQTIFFYLTLSLTKRTHSQLA